MPKAIKLSAREKDYIETNYRECSIKDLSEYVGKPDWLVRDFVESLNPRPSKAPRVNTVSIDNDESSPNNNIVICEELRRKPQWKTLPKELTAAEIATFEERYKTLMEQFQDDVLPTEETQIFQAIKLEIFMSRIDRNRLQIELDLIDIEQQIADQEMLPAITRDNTKLMNLKSQKNSLMTATPALAKEWESNADRHQKIMSSLKATREQRVKQAVDAKTNILGLLKLFMDEKFRKSQSLSMEVNKFALEDETKRLSQEHTYMNGDIDRPILTWETDQDGEETDSSPL